MASSDLTPEQKKILEADELKPFASNKRVKELFLSVDKILIRRGGVYNDKAMGKTINFSFNKQEDINELVEMLMIEEPKEANYCMCLGGYGIELYDNGQLKATIGLHHGTAIRYIGWKGDAELIDGKKLLKWFALKGYNEPLLDFEKENL